MTPHALDPELRPLSTAFAVSAALDKVDDAIVGTEFARWCLDVEGLAMMASHGVAIDRHVQTSGDGTADGGDLGRGTCLGNFLLRGYLGTQPNLTHGQSRTSGPKLSPLPSGRRFTFKGLPALG
jgi:hypothetical protein